VDLERVHDLDLDLVDRSLALLRDPDLERVLVVDRDLLRDLGLLPLDRDFAR